MKVILNERCTSDIRGPNFNRHLEQKNIPVHEFILSKDKVAIDTQIFQICKIAPLHSLTIEDCLKGNQRAKFERFPNYFFIVLLHFNPDSANINEIHIVLLDGSIVLIADDSPPEGCNSWQEQLRIDDSLSYSDVVHSIFDACIDSAETRMARLADIVGQAEELIVNEQFNPKMILLLKQQALRFQRAISGTFSVFREFLAVADLTLEQEILFRNILDHQERLKYELDFFHSELVALFDVYWGATSFYTNEQMKKLTALATVVVPLAFGTSFFGMNFETMPYKEPWFFYLALTLMLGSIVAVFFYLKRRGIFRSRQTRLNKSLLELLK